MGGEFINKTHSFLKLFMILNVIFLSATSTPSLLGKHHRYFEIGDQALLQKDYDKAIFNYLKGINYADKKDIAKVWDDLGYAYLQKEKYSDAITCLIKAIHAHPENFNPRLYLAAAYLFTGEVELASQELNHTEKNIYFDERWYDEAQSLTVMNENGDRIIQDTLEKLRREKGVYLHKTSKETDAKSQTVLYIDAFDDKNEAVFYFMQGLAYQKISDHKMARIKFQAASEAGFEGSELRSSQIHYQLKGHDTGLLENKLKKFLEVLKKGEIEEAYIALEEAMLINEQSFVINHNLALLYFDEYQLDQSKMEKLERAEIYCVRALWYKDYQPVNKDDIISSLDLMGNLYSLKMDYDKSLQEYKKILEIDKENLHALYNIGITYYNLKDFSSAEKEWKKVLESEKIIQNQVKTAENSQKKLEYSVTVRKMPVFFLVHCALGRLYFNQGQFNQAVTELETAIMIKNNAAEPHLLLAKVYQKMGTREKAVFHLEKYLFLGGQKKEKAKLLLKELNKGPQCG